jgi:hypothetical protein
MKIDPEGEITEEQLRALSKYSIETVVKDDKQINIVEILAEALSRIVIGMCAEKNVIKSSRELQRNQSKALESKSELRKSMTRKISYMEGSNTSLESDHSVKEEVRIPVPELKKLLREDNKDVDLLLLLFCLKEEDLKGGKYDDFFQSIVKKEKIRHKEKEFDMRQRAKKYLQNFNKGVIGDQSKLLSTWEKRLSMALEKFKNNNNDKAKHSGLFDNEGDGDVENKSHIKDLIRVRRRSMIQDFKGFEELNLDERSPKVHLREPPRVFINKINK